MTILLIKFIWKFKIIHNHKNDLCKKIASLGNLDVLKWARANGCPWDERTCSNAASGGHLEVLKYACENGCPHNHNRLCIISIN